MATPALLVQNQNLALNPDTPQSFRFLTKNPDGTPHSVAVGYTVNKIPTFPSSDANALKASVNLGGIGNFTFDATGVTWVLTSSDANAVGAALACVHSAYSISLTNDAGVTQAVSQVGTITINSFPA